MEILKHAILAIHIIGIASLLGGMLVQMKSMKMGETKIVPAIMHGAWTMLATGLLLVGLTYAVGDEPNNSKISVKTVVLLAIVVIALVNKKKDRLAGWVLPSLMGLTIVNIFLATMWR